MCLAVLGAVRRTWRYGGDDVNMPDCPYRSNKPVEDTCTALEFDALCEQASLLNAREGPTVAAGFLSGSACCMTLLLAETCPEGWR